jgi:hypothetical protein
MAFTHLLMFLFCSRIMTSFKRVASRLWWELNIIAVQISLVSACCLFQIQNAPFRKINFNGLTLLSRNYTCYVNLANYKCLDSFGWYNKWKRPFIKRSTWHLCQRNETEIIKNNLRNEEMLMRNEVCSGMVYTRRQYGVWINTECFIVDTIPFSHLE